MDVQELSDDRIREILMSHGGIDTPVNSSTRAVLLRKVAQLLQEGDPPPGDAAVSAPAAEPSGCDGSSSACKAEARKVVVAPRDVKEEGTSGEYVRVKPPGVGWVLQRAPYVHHAWTCMQICNSLTQTSWGCTDASAWLSNEVRSERSTWPSFMPSWLITLFERVARLFKPTCHRLW